jgi:hypothetical protein
MIDSLKLDPAIGVLLVGGFACLFASAAIHKLRHMRYFAEAFTGYGIATKFGDSGFLWLVPILELGMAVGLLLKSSRSISTVLGAALLIGYAGAMAVNLREGRDAIACGCAGPDQQRPIAVWMVWRNLFLALILCLSALPWRSRELELTDAATIGFGLITIALLYSCIERLLGNPLLRFSDLKGAR